MAPGPAVPVKVMVERLSKQIRESAIKSEVGGTLTLIVTLVSFVQLLLFPKI